MSSALTHNSMPDKEIISLIFLATAMATQVEATDIRGISLLADGINHAVPTHNEMQHSLSWLQKNGLVTKQAGKYQLTIKGKSMFDSARHSGKMLDIWKDLEERIAGNL
jgi:SOS-response transcriptional repressor LexA